MSINKYKPHFFVLPEDDANRQIANGFVLHPNVEERVIKLLPPARGWKKVLSKFEEVYISNMRQYSEERLILLIDFDLCKERLSYVKDKIPVDLQDRVFLLGVISNPESLKRDLGKSFEEIGEILANNCSDNTNELWEHELLQHNNLELDRIIASVKPFLFN